MPTHLEDSNYCRKIYKKKRELVSNGSAAAPPLSRPFSLSLSLSLSLSVLRGTFWVRTAPPETAPEIPTNV